MRIKLNEGWHRTKKEKPPVSDILGCSEDLLCVNECGQYFIGYYDSQRHHWIEISNNAGLIWTAPPVYWHEIPPLTK